jgi:hypothetical protein
MQSFPRIYSPAPISFVNLAPDRKNAIQLRSGWLLFYFSIAT